MSLAEKPCSPGDHTLSKRQNGDLMCLCKVYNIDISEFVDMDALTKFKNRTA
jgi:hypothetical protein